MKSCIKCGTTKSSWWYGQRCRKCYSREPHIVAAALKRQARSDVRYSKSKRQAISRGKVWEISVEEFSTLLEQPCVYCNNQLGTKEGFSSGLDRIDNNKGYVIDNVQPCCHICNTIRNEFLSVEETIAAVKAVLSVRKTKIDEESSLRRIRQTPD